MDHPEAGNRKAEDSDEKQSEDGNKAPAGAQFFAASTAASDSSARATQPRKQEIAASLVARMNHGSPEA